MTDEDVFKEMRTFMARGLAIRMSYENRGFRIELSEYSNGRICSCGAADEYFDFAWERAKRQLAAAICEDRWHPPSAKGGHDR